MNSFVQSFQELDSHKRTRSSNDDPISSPKVSRATLRGVTVHAQRSAHARDLQEVAGSCRVFLSMPYLAGVTPAALVEDAVGGAAGEPLPRRHGVFRPNAVGLSMFDHGALYGDSVFEGLLVTEGRIFAWREHVARLQAGARQLAIEIPYSPVELSLQLLRTLREAGLDRAERAYLRLVVTRGLGDLGIHPARCLGSTVYAIAARLQLYPEELYERGIDLSIARSVRRPGKDVLDPNIKSSNYLNNILALLETLADARPETLMLTRDGYVSEATADNLFLVEHGAGWETDPTQVRVLTPAAACCLEGITRGIVMDAARELGYELAETPTMIAGDLVGPGREVFLTGTAAGIIPVVSVGGRTVGDGAPGTVTREIHRRLRAAMADPGRGLSATAGRREIEEHLAPRSRG